MEKKTNLHPEDKGYHQPDDWKTNTIKNPDDWKTGDEPITGAQASYLETLASEAHQEIEVSKLTKAEAAKKIEELQHVTGRGLHDETK